MNTSLLIPRINPETNKALNAAASIDGLDAARLVERALERELKLLEKRRALIARNRLGRVFVPLRADAGCAAD